MNKKVTIQGYEGSFHQVAARQFYGKTVEVITCDTFREVVKIGADPKPVSYTHLTLPTNREV